MDSETGHTGKNLGLWHKSAIWKRFDVGLDVNKLLGHTAITNGKYPTMPHIIDYFPTWPECKPADGNNHWGR